MSELLRRWGPPALACAALIAAYKLTEWLCIEIAKVVYPWMF